MINGKKIFAYTWNSCEAIDDLIDYLNTLNLSDEIYRKLELLLDSAIDAYSSTKESAWGEDT